MRSFLVCFCGVGYVIGLFSIIKFFMGFIFSRGMLFNSVFCDKFFNDW